MVHLFMLVLVILYNTRLTNSIGLHCALGIQLEKPLCVDKVATGGNPGKNQSF